MSDSTTRPNAMDAGPDAELLKCLFRAESNAEVHYAAARRSATGEGFREVWGRDPDFSLARLKELLGSSTPGVEREGSLLTRQLGIWLALYFQGTPAGDYWHVIAEGLQRDQALPTYAFKMKAYGDVYRIERRRRAERAKLHGDARASEDALERLEGIITVVDHSIITHEAEHLSLLDPHAALGGTESGNREALARIRRDGSVRDEQMEAALHAMAERLARFYCSYQIVRYLTAKLPLRLFLLTEELPSEATKTASSFLKAGCGQEAYWYSPRDTAVRDVPMCVVGTHTGVLRQEGRWLGSPVGRQFDTRQLVAVAQRVRQLPRSKHPIFPTTSAAGH